VAPGSEPQRSMRVEPDHGAACVDELVRLSERGQVRIVLDEGSWRG